MTNLFDMRSHFGTVILVVIDSRLLIPVGENHQLGWLFRFGHVDAA